MLMSKKRSITNLLLIAAALALAYCLRFIFHDLTDNALLAIGMMTLRWAIQVPLTVLWINSIRRRILYPSLRRMLLYVGCLLLGWQIVRIIKYDYVIITEPIGRYCWYAFYIPMIFVPLIGIFVVNHIGKPESHRSPRWMKYLFIPAAFLLTVVFTNDLHQLVFTFHNGFELYNSDYGYGFMYIIIMGWFIVLTLFFVIGLLIKSRVPGSKRFQALPMVIAILGISFWVCYSSGLISCDLTAIDSLIIIMLLESAIQSGLIPSNMNYRGMFEQSTIAAQIVDKQQKIHFSSINAVPLEPAVMEQAMHEPVSLGNTVLHAQPIQAGHVFWQDDAKLINALVGELQEANETLEERNDLLRTEVALKKRRLQIEEKSRLYDQIAQEIAPQLNKVDELLQQSRKHPELDNKLLSQICVISAYIKRRANLILLGEEQMTVTAHELESCLQESLDNLRLCSIITYLDCQLSQQTDIKQIIAIYDLFESVTERMLDCMSAIMITARQANGIIELRMQIGCTGPAPELAELSFPGGTVSCEALEDDLIITAAFAQGGEQA